MKADVHDLSVDTLYILLVIRVSTHLFLPKLASIAPKNTSPFFLIPAEKAVTKLPVRISEGELWLTWAIVPVIPTSWNA
jgi:hypothetical protein